MSINYEKFLNTGGSNVEKKTINYSKFLPEGSKPSKPIETLDTKFQERQTQSNVESLAKFGIGADKAQEIQGVTPMKNITAFGGEARAESYYGDQTVTPRGSIDYERIAERDEVERFDILGTLKAEIDHIMPKGLGGTDVDSNLKTEEAQRNILDIMARTDSNDLEHYKRQAGRLPAELKIIEDYNNGTLTQVQALDKMGKLKETDIKSPIKMAWEYTKSKWNKLIGKDKKKEIEPEEKETNGLDPLRSQLQQVPSANVIKSSMDEGKDISMGKLVTDNAPQGIDPSLYKKLREQGKERQEILDEYLPSSKKGALDKALLAGVGDVTSIVGNLIEWTESKTDKTREIDEGLKNSLISKLQEAYDNNDAKSYEKYANTLSELNALKKLEGLGGRLKKLGSEMQDEGTDWNKMDKLGEFDYGDLLNPDFYTQKGLRSIPTLMSLVPLAVGGGYAGAAVGTAIGFGAFGTTVMGAIGGALASRPLESAFEGADTFGEAKRMGMSDDEADKAANYVFKKNMTLVGLDATEFALAFLPKKYGGGLVGKLFISGGLEMSEEQFFQYRFQQEALGKEVDYGSPEAREAGALGALMGLGLGGTGDVFTYLNEEAYKGYNKENKKKYDKAIDTKNKETIIKTLDEIAETENGKTSIEKATEDTKVILEKINSEMEEKAITTGVKPVEPKITEVKGLPVQEVKIKDLVFEPMDRKLAEQDFEAGKKSMTDLPVLAKKNDEGKLQVMDGNGRILQAEADGLETIYITTDEKLYLQKLKEQEITPTQKPQEAVSEVKPTKVVSDTSLVKEIQKSKELTYKPVKEAKLTSPTIKETKVGKSIEAKGIDKGILSGLENVAEYNATTLKEQTNIFDKFISESSKEDVLRVVKGQEQLPEGLKGASLLVGLENYAVKKGDAELLLELAKSPLATETSEAGQTLRLIRERKRDTVAARIYRLKRLRTENANRKLKERGKSSTEVKKSIKRSAKQTVKSEKITKSEWDTFLEEIRC